MAQYNGECQALLVVIMNIPFPHKSRVFIYPSKNCEFLTKILFRGKKTVPFEENVWVVQLFNWTVLSAESATYAFKISSSILKKDLNVGQRCLTCHIADTGAICNHPECNKT
jgi:hypothetical protein